MISSSGFKFAQLELSECTDLVSYMLISDVDSEVTLAVLLAHFKFESGKDEIVWNHAGVAYPTVGNDSLKPEMPLKASVMRT